MDVNHVSRTTILSPTGNAKFQKADESSNAHRQQLTPERHDRLTLSEEMRQLLKDKKIAESKQTEEAKAGKWEDVHKKTSKRRARQRKR